MCLCCFLVDMGDYFLIELEKDLEDLWDLGVNLVLGFSIEIIVIEVDVCKIFWMLFSVRVMV